MGLALRDEEDVIRKSDFCMQGGALLESHVILQKSLEGQDGLLPLTHEIVDEGQGDFTRMEVVIEPRGVGPEENNFLHQGEAVNLEPDVTTGMLGVVGDSLGSRNIKQWKRSARILSGSSVSPIPTGVLGSKRKEKSRGGKTQIVGKKRTENNEGKRMVSGPKVLAEAKV